MFLQVISRKEQQQHTHRKLHPYLQDEHDRNTLVAISHVVADMDATYGVDVAAEK